MENGRAKEKPVTRELGEDFSDYLEQNGLRVVPGSLRWEPDPKHKGRQRAVVDVEPVATKGNAE